MIATLLRLAAGVLLVSILGPNPSSAQATRAELLEQERSEKAAQLQPYVPGRLERGLLYLEEGGLERLFASSVGLYPRFGGITIGGGLAAGPAVRFLPFDRQLEVGASAAISTKRYKVVEADVSFPRLLNERLLVGANWHYRDFPREDFFGLGNDTLRPNRTSFLHVEMEYSAVAAFRPKRWLRVGGRTGVLNPGIGTGRDPRFPSIEALFDESAAPGIAAQPDFLFSELFADVDYRDAAGHPRDGGRYYASLSWYRDRDLHRYGFRRLDLSATQYFPFLEKRRIIALRAELTVTDPDEGSHVPFYLQPVIGGNSTLRGYREYRFRDRNALVMNAEYRWAAFDGLDMALFLDGGKVAADRGDIRFDDLHVAYGLGFRFNVASNVFLRIDVARSQEGVRYLLKFGPPF